jgi:hypothetical protein
MQDLLVRDVESQVSFEGFYAPRATIEQKWLAMLPAWKRNSPSLYYMLGVGGADEPSVDSANSMRCRGPWLIRDY